ncbi:MAG TPA: cupin domain-containing protein [Nitriliruptorales bacterium]|nr:cupin domain-containing protein [Nitriliruptorales bacterium]
MAGWVSQSSQSGGRTVEEVESELRAAGLSPRTFSNAPGDTYGWHEHADHKILFCVDGSITFHTHDADLPMHSGDRLDLEPGTEHSATVGDDGVVCTEAYADGPDAL